MSQETASWTRATETEDVFRDFARLGGYWASHGLSLGRQALEASAHTLRVTARALGELSDRLNEAETAGTGDAPGTPAPN